MKQISNNALINKPMDSDNMVNNEEHSNTSVCESDPISVNIHEYMLLKNENKSLKLEVSDNYRIRLYVASVYSSNYIYK